MLKKKQTFYLKRNWKTIENGYVNSKDHHIDKGFIYLFIFVVVVVIVFQEKKKVQIFFILISNKGASI